MVSAWKLHSVATVVVAALWLGSVVAKPKSSRPNIVWFLTDDQDQLLGASFPELNGVGPMPKTKALMADMGATANNFYIHTPICCPSRSELLSGRYFHNIKTLPDSKLDSCMHIDEKKVNNATFARYLKEQGGYTVGMFGKYLNNVPPTVPQGFDAWLANGGGDYLSPEFSVWNVDGLPNSTYPASTSWHGTPDNYTTAVVGNLSIAWIRKVVAEDPTRPFFAYVAPKAAHEPFNPAPWYAGYWDPSWPDHEPRPVNWNCSMESRANHHGNIATEPMITDDAATVITGVFKDRWRTLMSVDDVIADVIGAVTELGLADNTYFFYSSDHGFQLGEFNIPMDKRHVYEWDIKIHLLARGPGIKPGMTWDEPATQVDMASTWLGLAGLDKPDDFDGKSLAPLLINSSAENLPESTRAHLEQLGDVQRYKANWRTAAFIEYYYNQDNDKCMQSCNTTAIAEHGFPYQDSYCTDLVSQPNKACWGGSYCTTNCYATESIENNFIGLRSMKGSEFGNMLYAVYQTGVQAAPSNIDFANPDFHEVYDLDTDPWEMNNLYDKSNAKQQAMKTELFKWFNCRGMECP